MFNVLGLKDYYSFKISLKDICKKYKKILLNYFYLGGGIYAYY